MPPEESEVAGNLCHKTPIRSEFGEKQTEEGVCRVWPPTPASGGGGSAEFLNCPIKLKQTMFFIHIFLVWFSKRKKKKKRYKGMHRTSFRLVVAI